MISPEGSFHSGERQDSDGCPLPTNRFSFISSLKAAMNFYVHMKRSTEERGCQIVAHGQDTLRGKTGCEKCLEGWQVVGGNTLSVSRGIQTQLKTGIASRKLGRASPHAYPQAWYMLFLLNKKQKMMQQGPNTSP